MKDKKFKPCPGCTNKKCLEKGVCFSPKGKPGRYGYDKPKK